MALNKKDSKAYLFLGSPDVPFFDLKTNTWGCIKTKYEGAAWPYTKTIKNYAMHCIDGSLYIFGGKHDGSRVGQDLFMTLDIEKKTWTKLSGTTKAEKPDFFSPGPQDYSSTSPPYPSTPRQPQPKPASQRPVPRSYSSC